VNTKNEHGGTLSNSWKNNIGYIEELHQDQTADISLIVKESECTSNQRRKASQNALF
jgi:hypothetical protein